MMQEIKARKILQAIRGMAAVDQDMLADILMTVGQIGIENEHIKEIDINPLIISNGKPIAVDALVVLQTTWDLEGIMPLPVVGIYQKLLPKTNCSDRINYSLKPFLPGSHVYSPQQVFDALHVSYKMNAIPARRMSRVDSTEVQFKDAWIPACQGVS
jgi:hypothetical protein